MASAREVIFELVEGTGHNSVSKVESLFNSITMVDIDVDIQHPLEGFEELEDSQHAIIDIAKS